MKRTNVEAVMNGLIDCYSSSIRVIRDYRDMATSRVIGVVDGEERILQSVSEDRQTEKVNSLIAECEKNIKTILDNYSKSEADFFMLDGNNLTSDVKILEFVSSQEEIDRLVSKYKDNYTMLVSIQKVAQDKGFIYQELQSKESRMEIVNGFNRVILPRYREHTLLEDNESMSFEYVANRYKDIYLKKVIF